MLQNQKLLLRIYLAFIFPIYATQAGSLTENNYPHASATNNQLALRLLRYHPCLLFVQNSVILYLEH